MDYFTHTGGPRYSRSQYLRFCLFRVKDLILKLAIHSTFPCIFAVQRKTIVNQHQKKKYSDHLFWNSRNISGPYSKGHLYRGQFHQHSFLRADPKSAKRYSRHQCLFALLGSLNVKASRKNVGEIDSRCQFHQHFMHGFFCTKVFCAAFL